MSKSTLQSFNWQGRTDAEGGNLSQRWHQQMNSNQGDADLGLLGLSCDLGVQANKGRVGAKLGPDAIRSALANLAWHGDRKVTDLGNVTHADSLSETQAEYARWMSKGLAKHPFMIGLGGGHEIGWASYQGLYSFLSKLQQPKRIGIVNFDAHFDLRKPAPDTSSGTPFYQIAQHCEQNQHGFNYACLGVAESANTGVLFERAKKWQVGYLLDEQCQLENAQQLLQPMLNNIDELYVTICLDAFPAAVAPGVSAPASLGINVEFVINMLRWLHAQKSVCDYQWRILDIAELNPNFDIDKRTARLAARLIYETVRCQS